MTINRCYRLQRVYPRDGFWFPFRLVRGFVVAPMFGDYPTVILYLTAWPWQRRLRWHSM